MAYQFLTYHVQEGVATLTLNRPDVYNALNDEITFEMQDALKSAAKDEAVRVVVLTGAGKAFCAGQDLKAAPAGARRTPWIMPPMHRPSAPQTPLLHSSSRAQAVPVARPLPGAS